jgi:hypothetical protein
MTAAKLILPLMAFIAVETQALAEDRRAPLDAIPGFELRLLDKKFPVEITAGGITEVHGAPIWIFMPEAGRAQSSLEDICQTADLDNGAAFLPPPPDGFGLRALKLPIRESFMAANGRQAIVEMPVFVYFRRIESRGRSMDSGTASTIAAEPSAEVSSIESELPAVEAKSELDRLRAAMTDVRGQLMAVAAFLSDGEAKARLENIIQRLGSVISVRGDSTDYNPAASIDGHNQP